MPADHSATTPDPCDKCGGLLIPAEDEDGKYLRCMQCGKHLFIDEEAGDRERPEDHDAEQKCTWRPVKDETMDRYQQLREAILRQKLSPTEARKRWGISRTTYYRVLDGQRPSG